MTTEAWTAKVNKQDYINLKNFCTLKEAINIMKRQPKNGEIFVNYICDKGVISRIQKQFLQLNNKKSKDPIKVQVKDLNRCFSRENVQMVKPRKDTQYH